MAEQEEYSVDMCERLSVRWVGLNWELQTMGALLDVMNEFEKRGILANSNSDKIDQKQSQLRIADWFFKKYGGRELNVDTRTVDLTE